MLIHTIIKQRKIIIPSKIIKLKRGIKGLKQTLIKC